MLCFRYLTDPTQMLVRIVITLVVIALAIIYLRKRYQQQPPRKHAGNNMPARTSDPTAVEQFLNQARQHQGTTSNTRSPDKLRLGLIAAVLLVLVGGGAYSYLHWQDQQRLVTVLLHRDAAQPPVIYRVPKRNLGDGRFVTQDGTLVTISANERMEVVGL
jgi:hypothetical protein